MNNHNKCCSEKQIKDYLQNYLEPEERRGIEIHLLDCPFCSDALEGYKLITPIERAHNIIADLNESIEKRVEKKSNKRIIYLSIAAGVISILISSYFLKQFFNERSIPLASAEIGNTIQDSIKEKEEKVMEEVASDYVAIEKTNNSNKKLNNNQNIEKDPSSPSAQQEIQLSDSESENTGIIMGEIFQNEEIVAASAIQPAEYLSENKPAPAPASTITNVVKDKEMTKDDYGNAAKELKSETVRQEFAKAEVIETNVESKSKVAKNITETSPYQVCFDLYNQRRFNESLESTEMLLKISSSEMKDELLLNKAKCLIQIENKKEARKILKTLIEKNGKLKPKAEEILKSLRSTD